MSDDETIPKRYLDDESGRDVASLITDAVVYQPVLAYVVYALQSATADNARSAVLGHCTANEIADAKQVLWQKCGGVLIRAEMPRRRDTTARTIEEAHMQDIVVALQKLDGTDQIPHFAVLAHDLHKIPRWHPEEMNNASLAERMLRMEQRMSALQETVDHTMAVQLAAGERKLYTEVVAEPIAVPRDDATEQHGQRSTQRLCTSGDLHCYQRPRTQISIAQ